MKAVQLNSMIWNGDDGEDLVDSVKDIVAEHSNVKEYINGAPKPYAAVPYDPIDLKLKNKKKTQAEKKKLKEARSAANEWNWNKKYI